MNLRDIVLVTVVAIILAAQAGANTYLLVGTIKDNCGEVAP